MWKFPHFELENWEIAGNFINWQNQTKDIRNILIYQVLPLRSISQLGDQESPNYINFLGSENFPIPGESSRYFNSPI